MNSETSSKPTMHKPINVRKIKFAYVEERNFIQRLACKIFKIKHEHRFRWIYSIQTEKQSGVCVGDVLSFSMGLYSDDETSIFAKLSHYRVTKVNSNTEFVVENVIPSLNRSYSPHLPFTIIKKEA